MEGQDVEHALRFGLPSRLDVNLQDLLRLLIVLFGAEREVASPEA
jgi:hypothetical protein